MQNDADPIAWAMWNFDLPRVHGSRSPRFVREADTRDRNPRGALPSEFHVESFASAAVKPLYIPFLRNSQ